MAVKININLGEFFAKISPTAKQFHADLLSSGVEFHVTPLALKLTKDSEVLHSIPLPSAQVKDILAGKQIANAGMVETHLKQGILAAAESLPGKDKAPAFPKPAMNFVKPLPKQADPSFPIFPKDKLKSAALIALTQASQLYQPCHGTSAGSRYFVIGVAGPIKVAARIHAAKVSIRVEAPAMTKDLKDRLGEIGMKVGDTPQGNPYASLHVEADNDILQRKVVGSVLLALGEALQSPFPDIAVIRGV